MHLETAIRGAIIAERWPKSGLDIAVTVLEAEDDRWWGDSPGVSDASWGLMNVLAGCITATAAAVADAKIDCLDLTAGGVAALVAGDGQDGTPRLILDPDPSEHRDILALCVVGYLPSRDEITELWLKRDTSTYASEKEGETSGHEALIDGAVAAARGVHTVLTEAVRESAERLLEQASLGSQKIKTLNADSDVEMKL